MVAAGPDILLDAIYDSGRKRLPHYPKVLK
jgi:hypothetical protein